MNIDYLNQILKDTPYYFEEQDGKYYFNKMFRTGYAKECRLSNNDIELLKTVNDDNYIDVLNVVMMKHYYIYYKIVNKSSHEEKIDLTSDDIVILPTNDYFRILVERLEELTEDSRKRDKIEKLTEAEIIELIVKYKEEAEKK